MSKLDTKQRNDLSDNDFALPGRKYPVPDENHAQAALIDVAKFGTPEEQHKVRAVVQYKFPNIKVSK